MPDRSDPGRGSVPNRLPWRPVLWPWTMRVVVVLFLLGIASALVQHLAPAGGFVGDDLLVRFTDLDNEFSLGTWYSVAQLLAAAAVSLAAGVTEDGPRVRRGWLTLAVLLTMVSADEITKIHEHLAGLMSETLDVSAWLWVVPGAAVAGVAGALLVPFLRAVDRGTARRLSVGLGTFVFGALVLEGVSGLAYDAEADGRTLAFVLIANTEELLELTGIALVLRAIALHLEARGVRFELHHDVAGS